MPNGFVVYETGGRAVRLPRRPSLPPERQVDVAAVAVVTTPAGPVVLLQNELGDLFHLAGDELFAVGCAKPATAIVASGDVVLLAAESGNQSARRV